MEKNKYSPLVLTIIVLGLLWAAWDRTIYKEASVINGDTLEIEGMKVRLFGIDAPETGQVCDRGKGEELETWNCGTEAKNHISKLVNGAKVMCFVVEKDMYKRLISICYNSKYQNINREMVRAGYAVAFVQYSSMFTRQETEAKEQRRGLWAGNFKRSDKPKAMGKNGKLIETCTPKSSQSKVLYAPDAEAIADEWRDAEIGLNWTFIVKDTLRSDVAQYKFGKLVSPKGNILPNNYYILAKEWKCEKAW